MALLDITILYHYDLNGCPVSHPFFLTPDLTPFLYGICRIRFGNSEKSAKAAAKVVMVQCGTKAYLSGHSCRSAVAFVVPGHNSGHIELQCSRSGYGMVWRPCTLYWLGNDTKAYDCCNSQIDYKRLDTTTGWEDTVEGEKVQQESAA